MKKVFLGTVLGLAMVGCGVQTTPVVNTDITPDIHSIVAENALMPLATEGANLLSNGGFENGLSAWAGCDAGVLSQSTDAYSGNEAARVTNNCFFQSINVVPGTQYTLSCYIKEIVDSGWTGMGFNFTDIEWKLVGPEISVEAASNGYSVYNITREAPATATYGSMWVFSSGLANVDSCEIVEGGATNPTPVAPVTPTPVTPEPEMPADPEPVTTEPVDPVDSKPVTSEPEMPVDSEPEMPTDSEMPEGAMSITDIAIDAGLNKLVAALKATGLDQVLAQDKVGPFTVFAPTDEAFDAILAALGISFEELTSNFELTKQILLYHVILDELSLETLEEAQAAHDTRFETMSFLEDIDFGVFDGVLYLDDLSGRKIASVQSDVVGSNGIVHVIDSVLLPPSVQETLNISKY